MNLTPSDKVDLHGECGEARQMAMRVLVRMRPVMGRQVV